MTGTYRKVRRWRQAFTLVELLVASAVATIVTAGALVLLIESAKENRRGFADATVEAAAAALQSKIIAYLRVMSATEGVIFATPATDGSGALLGYKGIIIARGPSPDFPREQITFDVELEPHLKVLGRLAIVAEAELAQPRVQLDLRELLRGAVPAGRLLQALEALLELEALVQLIGWESAGRPADWPVSHDSTDLSHIQAWLDAAGTRPGATGSSMLPISGLRNAQAVSVRREDAGAPG